jgi:TetR/AcrR family transcriptional regulator
MLTDVVNGFWFQLKGGNSLYSKFFNLEKEKQDRIINAALKEFAQKGYDNASTNEIVKRAEISKGLLFHYFTNKKQLFLFLYDYCVELTMEEFYSKIDFEEKDFFNRMRQGMIIKMGLLRNYPEMVKFLGVALIEDSSDVKNDLDSKSKELMISGYSRMFQNIDISKFKENMDIEKIINIITWTLEGFANRQIEKMKLLSTNLNELDNVFTESNIYYAEADVYIEMLRNWFYK